MKDIPFAKYCASRQASTMQNTQESSQDDMTTPPRGFMSLKSVLSMSNEDVIKKKPLVNIIGVVTDVQPARYFRGLGMLRCNDVDMGRAKDH